MGCFYRFTQKNWGEILCYKIKLLSLARWENDPPQSISKSAEQTKKSGDIVSPQITAHVFYSLRTADPFPVVASLLFFGGREATTGNASAVRRLVF